MLESFDWFVLAYFVVLNSSYLLLIGVAAHDTARAHRRPATAGYDDVFANPLTPAISVLVPAHDEEVLIVDSVRSMFALRYPHFEVVVVDDGSTDGTFEALRAEFDLIEVAPDFDAVVPTIGQVRSVHVPRDGLALVVVRKEGAGSRADAINVAINAAHHPLVCCVDADSILERDALLQVAKPFVDDPERVIASGGTIRAVNGSAVYRGQLSTVRHPRNWLVRIQILEYLRSFLLGRTAWSKLGALMIISGAFGLYRRDRLVEAGGFDPRSMAEDADVLLTLHKLERDAGRAYRAVFIAVPVCWTEVPSNRQILARQRVRWSYGLAQVLWKRRSMMLNPRYGRIGMVTLPYYLAFELLGAAVELVGVVAVIAGLWFGAVNLEYAALFAVVAFLYGIAVSLAAVLVEEVSFHRYDRWRDLGATVVASVLENIGYRQLHAWWRLKGLLKAMRGSEPAWGVMTRTGFTAEEVTA
ncbi:glycosyltransferase family 2 protein [Ilumatobacter sp.]|uniref:glycosyltransferase family 2 protein n=1 Tax=Ilumatobacter sp. TaxID=1967498 RepID=UPI003B5278F1